MDQHRDNRTLSGKLRCSVDRAWCMIDVREGKDGPRFYLDGWHAINQDNQEREHLGGKRTSVGLVL